MKIILASRPQFEAIWNKTMPCNWGIGEFGVPFVFLPSLNARVVVEDEVEIGSIVGIVDDPFKLEEVKTCIEKNWYRRIG